MKKINYKIKRLSSVLVIGATMILGAALVSNQPWRRTRGGPKIVLHLLGIRQLVT